MKCLCNKAGGEHKVDLDFAHPGNNISIAINHDFHIDTHRAIDSLKMGFLPVNERTRYVKPDESDFDLDFLTSSYRGSYSPLSMKSLNLTLQPIRFMEFSMEDPIVCVLPASSGPIVVNLPRPERYALAKLMLYPERLTSKSPEKANKDLVQAASLIEYLGENQPETLQDAWMDLCSRGAGWKKLAQRGIDELRFRYPEIDVQFDIDNPSGSKGHNRIR